MKVSKRFHINQPFYANIFLDEILLTTPFQNVTGLTNYPIGVGINGAGEVTIADNHNNFNLSVFSQEGKLIIY